MDETCYDVWFGGGGTTKMTGGGGGRAEDVKIFIGSDQD